MFNECKIRCSMSEKKLSLRKKRKVDMLVEFRNYLSLLSDVSNIKEENNTISFEYKGLFFLFVTDESDQYYIRLLLPNIATTDNLKNGVDIHTIINDYNNKFKVVKVSLWDKSVWLSIEQFLYSKERANDLFTRAISILEIVINEFRREYINQ